MEDGYKVVCAELFRMVSLSMTLSDPEPQFQAGPSRGGKGGKFSRAQPRLGPPASLKNTENGVPGGFFLT